MSEEDTRAVLEAVRRRSQALVAADAPALSALLHPQFQWTSHRGDTFDRDAYVRANVRHGIDWQHQSVGDVSVAVVGDTAVVRAIATDQVVRGGRSDTFQMPMTQTWVRTDGRWTCLAGHAGPRRSSSSEPR